MKRPRFNELFCLLAPSSGYTIFKSRSTAPIKHCAEPAILRMPTKKRKRAKFLKKDRDTMVSELEKKRKESSDDIFEEIIAKLQAGIDLKCHESRKRFVDYLCSESHARKALAKSVDMMVKNYYRLLKPGSTPKESALLNLNKNG